MTAWMRVDLFPEAGRHIGLWILMLARILRFGGLYSALVYLALLLGFLGQRAFAQEAPVPPQPISPTLVPAIPHALPSPQERLLSPIPEQFEWMRRDVRPNPLLEGLLALREGPPRLFMSLSLAEEYSDNFFRREREREDEYRTILSIGTVYRLERGRSFVSLANSISATYEARSERSHFAFDNLSLNAGYGVPPWSFALSESFIRSDNLDEVSPFDIRRERRTFLRNSVSPQVRYDFSRNVSGSLAYVNTLVLEEDQSRNDTDGLIGSEDRGHTVSHAFVTGLQLQFTPALNGELRYTFTTEDSDRAADTEAHAASADLRYRFDLLTILSLRAFGSSTDRSSGGIDSQFYGVSIGVGRQLTSFLSAFVSVGPTLLDRENRAQRIFVNWQANLEGALPMLRTRRTSLSLSGQQNVENTVGEVDEVGIVLRQSLTLSLNHALSRDLQTSLFASYARQRPLEDVGTPESIQGRKDNFWSVGARAAYALTRTLSLSMNYVHQRRESNLTGGDYAENRVAIALSVGFPIF